MGWKYSSNFEPLYYKIQKDILQDVEAERFKPGDKLPSENEISERYDVSVITAKRVLKNLMNLGLAFTVKGKGTYLAKSFSFGTSGLSFTEQMLFLGLNPSSHVLQFEIRKPDPEACAKLQLNSEDSVYYIKRVRLANKNPMGLELSVIPVNLCPNLTQHNLEKESLFKILREEYDIETVWGDAEIFAASATEEETSYLKLPKNSPVIKQKRVHFTEDFTPFEFLLSTFHNNSRFMFLSGRFRMAHPF